MIQTHIQTADEEKCSLPDVPCNIDEQVSKALQAYTHPPLMSINEVADPEIRQTVGALQQQTLPVAGTGYSLPEMPVVTDPRSMAIRVLEWIVRHFSTDRKRREMDTRRDELLTIKRAEAQYAWMLECRTALGNAGKTLQDSFLGIQQYREQLETLITRAETLMAAHETRMKAYAAEALAIKGDTKTYAAGLIEYGLSAGEAATAVLELTGQQTELGRKIARAVAEKTFLAETIERYRGLAAASGQKLDLVGNAIHGAGTQLQTVQDAIIQYEGLVVHEKEASRALAFLETVGDLTTDFLVTQAKIDKNLEMQAVRYQANLDFAQKAYPSIPDLAQARKELEQ